MEEFKSWDSERALQDVRSEVPHILWRLASRETDRPRSIQSFLTDDKVYVIY